MRCSVCGFTESYDWWGQREWDQMKAKAGKPDEPHPKGYCDKCGLSKEEKDAMDRHNQANAAKFILSGK